MNKPERNELQSFDAITANDWTVKASYKSGTWLVLAYNLVTADFYMKTFDYHEDAITFMDFIVNKV